VAEYDYDPLVWLSPVAPGLEDAFGIDSPATSWERGELFNLRWNQSWNSIGFLGIWEVQSQLSAIVLLTLTALVPPLLAFLPMLAWSLMATVIYYYARERGLPDLLEIKRSTEPRRVRNLITAARELGLTAAKAWLAGLQSFIFSRSICRILGRPAITRKERLLRLGVVALGLTMFGVSTSQHVLRRAGYSGSALLRIGFAGSALNVGYRVLLSALFVDLAARVIGTAV
jgi:hypothetical protein